MPDTKSDDDMQKAVDLAKSMYTPSPDEAYTQGRVLPIKKYESGRLEFDPSAGLFGGATRALTALGRAMQGDFPIYEMDENGERVVSPKAIDEAMNVASQVMLGSAPSGIAQTLREGFDPNVIRTFAGASSKTADLAALEMAQNLEAKGMDRNFIWKHTGWGRNPAGQWFYEIPDNEVRVRAPRMENGVYVPRESTLGAEVHHPEAYEAYPDLRDIKFKIEDDIKGYGGAYTKPTQNLNPNLPEIISIGAEDPREVLIHELNHAIQFRENFPRGGNPADPSLANAARLVSDQANADIAHLQGLKYQYRDDFIKNNPALIRTPEDRALAYDVANMGWERDFPKEAAKLNQAYKNLNVKGPTAAYKLLAGEIQPNIAMKSIDWNPQIRREIAPWHRDKTPYASQVVRTQQGDLLLGKEFKADGGRTGYATKGSVAEDEDFIGPALDIARRFEDPAARIEAGIRGLSSNLAGLDIEANVPQFHTGLNRPQVGGAGLLPPRPSNVSSQPITRSGADILRKDPALAANPPVMSERGRPFHELEFTYVPRNNLVPWKPINVEDLYKERAYIAPAVWDRTSGNITIQSILGNKLSSPFNTQGGGDFQRGEFARGENPAASASRPSAVKTIMSRINSQPIPEDRPLYLSSTLMGQPASDSSVMMAKALLRQIDPSKIDQSGIDAVNKYMGSKIKDWPGIENPKAVEELLSRNNIGTQTSLLSEALDKANPYNAGMPDVGAARFAITDPRLFSPEQLATGYSMSKIDLSKKPYEIEDGHETYPTKMPSVSGYEGGLKYQVPSSVMFLDWFKGEKKFDKNGNLITPTMRQQSLMTKIPVQEANQEWLDNIMKHQEEHKKVWGYREGGRTMGNNAIDNALRMARGHYDDGGDVRGGDSVGGLRGDTGAYSGMQSEAQAQQNAETAREVDRMQAERQSEQNQMGRGLPETYGQMGRGLPEGTPSTDVSPFSFGQRDMLGLSPLAGFMPQNVFQATQQRLGYVPETIEEAAKNPSYFFGMGMPGLVGLQPSRAGMAGYIGNLAAESDMNPSALNPSGALGLAQWTGSRREALLNALGVDKSLRGQSLADALAGTGVQQFGYGLNEMATNPGYARSFNQLTGAVSPERAATIMMKNFERPSAEEQASSAARRAAEASGYYQTGQVAEPVSSTMQALLAGTRLAQGQRGIGQVAELADPNVTSDATQEVIEQPAQKQKSYNLGNGYQITPEGDVVPYDMPLGMSASLFKKANQEQVSKLESEGKTVLFPDAYSKQFLTDEEGNTLTPKEWYAKSQGLNPDNPEDMAKVMSGIQMVDGQQRVNYFTKDPDKAILGALMPGAGIANILGKLFGEKSQDQQVDDAVKAAREGGGGGERQQQAMVTLPSAPISAPAPYTTELSPGSLALKSKSGLSPEQFAALYTGGDLSKVHARVVYVNGAPQVEYYSPDIQTAVA